MRERRIHASRFHRISFACSHPSHAPSRHESNGRARDLAPRRGILATTRSTFLSPCLQVVASSWHRVIAPLLYKSVSRLKPPFPSVKGITRYAEHIRHLSIMSLGEDPEESKGLSVFTSHSSLWYRNLQSLEVLLIDYNDQNSRATCEALILLNQNLRKLRIIPERNRAPRQLSWSIVFSQCSRVLQNLTLYFCRLNAQEAAQLMEVEKKLKCLSLQNCHFVWSEFAAEPLFPEMNDLKIKGMFEAPAQDLCWIVQCPRLRVLSWDVPQVGQDVFTTKLAFHTLQNRTWEHMRLLKVTGYLSDSQVARMLSACGPLQELAIRSSGFWYRSLAALERHSETLKTLWLRGCDNLRSWMCQRILASFRNLESFKTGRLFAHEMVTGHGAEEARANQLAQDARDDIATRQQEITKGEMRWWTN